MGNNRFCCSIKAHFPRVHLLCLPWLSVQQVSLCRRGIGIQGWSAHECVQDLGPRGWGRCPWALVGIGYEGRTQAGREGGAFIHSSSQHLLSTLCVPGSVQGRACSCDGCSQAEPHTQLRQDEEQHGGEEGVLGWESKLYCVMISWFISTLRANLVGKALTLFLLSLHPSI